MRKNHKFSAVVKGALAATLSLSMAVTSFAFMPTVAQAEDVAPVKVLDFNKGLRGFKGTNYDLDKKEFAEGEGDANYTVVKSPSVMYQKIGDQLGSGDKVDANNFIYMGTGNLAKYHTTVTSNQPATMYDSVKGSVYVLFDTVQLKELVKNVPADIVVYPEGSDPATSTGTPDAEASESLDKEKPVDSVVREAMTVKCAAEVSNPLYGSTSDAVTVTYWVYTPAGNTKDAALFAFDNSVTSFDENDVKTTVKKATEVFFDADSTVAPAGAWTHVAMVVTADGVKFYVNGVETTETYVTGETKLTAFTSPKKLTLGGTENGVMDTVYDTRLDDMAFYEVALTADQIVASYQAGLDAMATTTDVTAPAQVFSLNDLAQITDLGKKTTVSVVDETINGTAIKALKVEGNTKSSEKTGFVLNENPFAGKDLEGLTVGFWAKMETNCAASLVFMDDKKVVYNPKEEDQSQEGQSYLYIDNAKGAVFKEGAYYDCAAKIKNTFTFAGAFTEDELAAAKQDATQWQYVTMTANNGGVKLYINGVALENKAENIYGIRFLDGYNAAVLDLADPQALNGIFGGTNNQCATQLMSFLGYADTKMYFGWFPNTSRLNAKTGDSVFYNLSCYTSDMTDEEVAALYNQEIAALGGGSTGGETGDTVLYGDVDGNEFIEAADALEILKAVVKLTTLTETQTKAADVDGNEVVEAADALCVLQYVVKLINKFPVEA